MEELNKPPLTDPEDSTYVLREPHTEKASPQL